MHDPFKIGKTERYRYGSQSYHYGYKRDAGSIPVLRETVVSLNGKTITYFALVVQ